MPKVEINIAGHTRQVETAQMEKRAGAAVPIALRSPRHRQNMKSEIEALDKIDKKTRIKLEKVIKSASFGDLNDSFDRFKSSNDALKDLSGDHYDKAAAFFNKVKKEANIVGSSHGIALGFGKFTSRLSAIPIIGSAIGIPFGNFLHKCLKNFMGDKEINTDAKNAHALFEVGQTSKDETEAAEETKDKPAVPAPPILDMPPHSTPDALPENKMVRVKLASSHHNLNKKMIQCLFENIEEDAKISIGINLLSKIKRDNHKLEPKIIKLLNDFEDVKIDSYLAQYHLSLDASIISRLAKADYDLAGEAGITQKANKIAKAEVKENLAGNAVQSLPDDVLEIFLESDNETVKEKLITCGRNYPAHQLTMIKASKDYIIQTELNRKHARETVPKMTDAEKEAVHKMTKAQKEFLAESPKPLSKAVCKALIKDNDYSIISKLIDNRSQELGNHILMECVKSSKQNIISKLLKSRYDLNKDIIAEIFKKSDLYNICNALLDSKRIKSGRNRCRPLENNIEKKILDLHHPEIDEQLADYSSPLSPETIRRLANPDIEKYKEHVEYSDCNDEELQKLRADVREKLAGNPKQTLPDDVFQDLLNDEDDNIKSNLISCDREYTEAQLDALEILRNSQDKFKKQSFVNKQLQARFARRV